MSAINQTMSLNDEMSSVVGNILNSMRPLLQSLESLQGIMNSDVDTSSLESMAENIANVNSGTSGISETLGEINRQIENIPDIDLGINIEETTAVTDTLQEINKHIENIPDIDVAVNVENVPDVEIDVNVENIPDIDVAVNVDVENLSNVTNTINDINNTVKTVSDLEIAVDPSTAGNISQITAKIAEVNDKLKIVESRSILIEAVENTTKVINEIGEIGEAINNVGDFEVLTSSADNLQVALSEIVLEVGDIPPEISTAIEVAEQLQAIFVEVADNAGDIPPEVTRVVNEVERLRAEASRAPPEVERLTSEVVNLKNQAEGIPQAFEESNRQLNLMQKAIGALAIGRLIGMARGFFNTNKAIADTYVLKNAQIAMMNDGLQTNEELQGMIFNAARRSNAEFAQMAGVIAKLNATVGEIFINNASVIQFTETIKQAASISATGAHGIEMSFRAIDRAMAEGALSARDFDLMKRYNIRAIEAMANYLDVSVMEMRNLATQGNLTSDVIAGALLGATDMISTEFQQIPKTWEDIMVGIRNSSLQAFSPLMNAWNEFINSASFINGLEMWKSGIRILANVLLILFNIGTTVFEGITKVMEAGANIIVENLNLILLAIMALGIGFLALQAKSAITFGVQLKKDIIAYAKSFIFFTNQMITAYVKSIAFGVKNFLKGQAIKFLAMLKEKKAMISVAMMNIKLLAAQKGATLLLAKTTILAAKAKAIANVKAALMAALAWFKLLIPIALFAGAIVAGIMILNKFGISAADVIGFVAGVFGGMFAFVFNLFATLWNIIASVVEFFANVWNHPVYSVQKLFYNLVSSILNWFASIIDATGGVGDAIVNAFLWGVNGAIGLINGFINFLSGLPLIGPLFDGFQISELSGPGSGQSSGDWIRGLADNFHPGDAPDGYWEAPKFELKDIMETATQWNDKAHNFLDNMGDLLGGFGDFDLPEMPPMNQEIGLDHDFLDGLNNLGDLGSALGPGQNIGNIGEILGDVDISDEDIKLMRDISRRDRIIQYQPLSPNVQVTVNNEDSDINEEIFAERVAETILEKVRDNLDD